MAYIKVDHSKFARASRAVDDYVTLLKNKMDQAQREVDNMSRSWQGTDYTMFKNRWEKVTAHDSTYKQMIKSLESYSDFLTYAENKYKEAQTNAVNRANQLPWW